MPKLRKRIEDRKKNKLAQTPIEKEIETVINILFGILDELKQKEK